MSKRGDLKQKVLATLAREPETRDCDVKLTISIWTNYYRELIKQGSDGNLGVYLKDILKLPREDSIKRYRAIIQNDELKFLPTTWEVARRRKLNEQVWRSRTCNIHFPKAMENHLAQE